MNKNVRFKTPMLKSDLWDYSYTYITVKGTTDLLVDAANENDKVYTDVTQHIDKKYRRC